MLTFVSLALAGCVFPVALYLGVLTLFSRRTPPPPANASRRLVCVVPAHDEQVGIGATVRSLLEADYPPALRRVVVVADNCSDDTAARARAAGATVVVRNDAARRGKGYALEAGFAYALADPTVDGVIVVDADTVVAPNLWRAVSARLVDGALALQVTNAVRNGAAGWRPRLQAIGMAAINGVRSLGRERLGLSTGLRGTGMAFSRACLERVPHAAHGVVEDVEYGVRLGVAGIRVAFAPETWIRSDAPAGAVAALSQRRRWEGGRFALARAMVPRLLRDAVHERSAALFDLACDLAVPPLGYVALVAGVGVAVELGAGFTIAAPLWAFDVVALAAYVLRAVAFSGEGVAGLFVLATAPAYVAWKIVVARPWRRTDRWVRTQRVSDGAAKS